MQNKWIGLAALSLAALTITGFATSAFANDSEDKGDVVIGHMDGVGPVYVYENTGELANCVKHQDLRDTAEECGRLNRGDYSDYFRG